MRILGLKEGHDGAIALIEDGTLIFHLEPEKDSFPRCADVTAEVLLNAASLSDELPDVIAIGGWTKGRFSSERQSMSGYFGASDNQTVVKPNSFFGKQINVYSSTHERSHIWCAYGLSPFPQGEPCHILIWEGNIGNFYTIASNLSVCDHGRVITDPGNKYTFLYSLADPRSPSWRDYWDTGHPGKLMALAAYGNRGSATNDEAALIEYVLSRSPIMTTTLKDDVSWSPFHNIGVESQAFKDLAAKFTDRVFDTFYEFAAKNLSSGLPLLIAGGCGLNCEWNSRWRECGLFSEVFVPPCYNDSGSALGTAIDAQRHFVGSAKVEWTPYAGQQFVWDREPPSSRFVELPYDRSLLSKKLAEGALVAWVEGRYEMGPRGRVGRMARYLHV
jgi:predicted NodU family carbamoyl transferase